MGGEETYAGAWDARRRRWRRACPCARRGSGLGRGAATASRLWPFCHGGNDGQSRCLGRVRVPGPGERHAYLRTARTDGWKSAYVASRAEGSTRVCQSSWWICSSLWKMATKLWISLLRGVCQSRLVRYRSSAKGDILPTWIPDQTLAVPHEDLHPAVVIFGEVGGFYLMPQSTRCWMPRRALGQAGGQLLDSARIGLVSESSSHLDPQRALPSRSEIDTRIRRSAKLGWELLWTDTSVVIRMLTRERYQDPTRTGWLPSKLCVRHPRR